MSTPTPFHVERESGAYNPSVGSPCSADFAPHIDSLGAYVEPAEKNVYTNNEHKQRCFVCANCAEDSQELRDADLCFYCMERLCRKCWDLNGGACTQCVALAAESGWGRKMQGLRSMKRGGRPKIKSPCRKCRKKFGVRDLRLHLPRCNGKQ